MAIYLGESGHIELQRRSINENYTFILHVDDVDELSDRFSFDGIDQNIFLITGDRVRFERLDGQPLQLVDGVTDRTGVTYYVHVDTVGGLRLYDTFNESLSGKRTSAVQLIQPTEDQELEISLEELDWRCLAQTKSYSITTARETLDLTNLGDEFRRNYASGLINGQGECLCQWDFDGPDDEYANYVAKLVLRLQIGSAFNGRFYIKDIGASSLEECRIGQPSRSAVWWEATCIVTNVSMAFSPAQVIETSIQFVTSDVFTLRAGIPEGYLLQDPASDPGSKILDDDTGCPIRLDTDA